MTELKPGITVVIPTIPPRAAMLQRAARSVIKQTLLPVELLIEWDDKRTGSAATRNRALDNVRTQWVAWLDDDDEFLPWHLETLVEHARLFDADVVYSLPRVLDAAGHRIARRWEWGGGLEFDPELLRVKSYINVTSLMRTELARSVGGFRFVTDETGASNDDHGIYLALLDAGAKFHHVHHDTFIWHHHGYGTAGVPGNTSGDPARW